MHDHVAGRKGPEKEQSPAPYLADISLEPRNGGLQESPLEQDRTCQRAECDQPAA